MSVGIQKGQSLLNRDGPFSVPPPLPLLLTPDDAQLPRRLHIHHAKGRRRSPIGHADDAVAGDEGRDRVRPGRRRCLWGGPRGAG